MMTTIKTASTASVRAPDAPASGATLHVTSDSFADGGTIPRDNVFTGAGGKNMSPQLSWSGAPAATRSIVITCFDPDAPTGSGYWHWLAFDIPATATSLAAGAGTKGSSSGGRAGYNDFGQSEYDGPAPPKGDGPHRYIFTVYALDVAAAGASEGTTGATLIFSIRGHVLASGSITGTFGH